jgi:nitrous oxide reductase accessory protein NosL
MKQILFIVLLTNFLFGMNNFRMVPKEDVKLLQEGKNKKYCPICGMTLPFFYKTNHAAKHNNEQKQYCSIVCMAQDEIENKKELTNYKAVDANHHNWIDSKQSYFVVGSDKPSTMSHISKYAFSSKQEAQDFAKEYGGEVIDFDTLYNRVKLFLGKEIEATKKRQAKAAKKGEMVYNKFCKKTDIKFESVADAKSYIVEKKLCGNMQGKKLQMVGLYLLSR